MNKSCTSELLDAFLNHDWHKVDKMRNQSTTNKSEERLLNSRDWNTKCPKM